MSLGVNETPLKRRRWFPRPAQVQVQPVPNDHEQKRGYPFQTMAARGPDWGIGENGFTGWHPSVLRQDNAVNIQRGNYGLMGRKTVPIRDGSKDNPGPSRNVYYGRVRPVNWDPLQYPTFIPSLPTWNNLPKGALYNMRIPSANRSANYRVSRTPYNIGKPMHYDQARPARLMAGVN